MLRRKIDLVLSNWKNNKKHKPLIVYGARQIGKTTSIRQFGKSYSSFVEINFVMHPEYKTLFNENFDVDNIVKQLTFLNPNNKFIENDTLILLDEIQDCPNAITALKFFAEDNRFDVICSGSLLGVNYNHIASVPVGFKEEYQMYSLDFEEYLWANGYNENQIDDIFTYMQDLKRIPDVYFNKLNELFNEFIFVGGMPEVVNNFVSNRTFNDIWEIQNRIYKDYEDDVSKYVVGLDKAKVKNVYRHIVPQLAKDNHKFQITKIGHGARKREYEGVEEWLKDAGIINIAYNLDNLDIPFSTYENSDYVRIYFADHSLFIADLDEESKKDLIINKNYNIYNGALYESLVSEALIKSGYKLYFYKNTSGTIELDFLIRSKNNIVPIEVKRKSGKTISLNTVLNNNLEKISIGVKLTNQNIGFENGKITFPYFLTFLLKRFFDVTDLTKWK